MPKINISFQLLNIIVAGAEAFQRCLGVTANLRAVEVSRVTLRLFFRSDSEILAQD
jgi:hypothetical protein